MSTDEKPQDNTPYKQDSEFVTCSVFGESFKLRCSKKDKLKLSRAVTAIESKCAKMLKESPFLRPVQAAILVALNTQSELIEYKDSKKTLPDEAKILVEAIKAELLGDKQ